MIRLKTINIEEKEMFLEMADRYFKELNPRFRPQKIWEDTFFENLHSSQDYNLKWAVNAQNIIGFAIYGLTKHIYLDRNIGNIYEFYIVPSERRSGHAESAAKVLLTELKEYNPAKIQLEIMEGNEVARQFWKAIGFSLYTHKYVFGK